MEIRKALHCSCAEQLIFESPYVHFCVYSSKEFVHCIHVVQIMSKRKILLPSEIFFIGEPIDLKIICDNYRKGLQCGIKVSFCSSCQSFACRIGALILQEVDHQRYQPALGER